MSNISLDFYHSVLIKELLMKFIFFLIIALLSVVNASLTDKAKNVYTKAKNIAHKLNNPPSSVTYNNPVLKFAQKVPGVGHSIGTVARAVRAGESIAHMAHSSYQARRAQMHTQRRQGYRPMNRPRRR